ncbi:hypothetical protein GGC65_001564 [Sphingopyxis sp. OAS728]|uniref:hypothetical protein n=1 Tax=Sphingopyxis sp. OAS728 TaxID=2663823 RepID=UPI00178AB8F4|nr:hypothetical protein [Sphingopyxis sp. OAS728]MBE1527108.1 hypothetical protein [Sphingopyxis sp. OAS728]
MRLLTLFAAALCGTAAVAQEVPIIVKGAGGRFETQLDAKTVVPGFPGDKIRQFRRSSDALIAMLEAMPEVNAPPAPFCNRLKSWIEILPLHGVLGAEIGVMNPINFSGGKCHRMTATGVIFRLNSLSLLLDPQEALMRAGEGEGNWWLVRDAEIANRRIIEIRDAVAFTHGRAPLLIPVSTGRYLRRQIAIEYEGSTVRHQLEARLADLDPTERAAPACLLRTTGALVRDCRAADTVMELNPAYFDKSRPEAVQLLVVETPPSAGHGETADRFAARKAIWNALDHNKFAAMVN